jgi:hypothetical protein
MMGIIGKQIGTGLQHEHCNFADVKYQIGFESTEGG